MRWVGAKGMPKNSWKVVPFGELAAIGKPKKLGRGMPEMPLGPPVMLAQFSRMTRIISPKPSVTMAR